MKKSRKAFIILSPLLCLILIWGVQLVKCEIITMMHKDEFLDQTLYEENTMIGDMEYIKVLNYSKNYARIYYVSKGHSLGSLIGFIRDEGKWKYSEWEAGGWSASGNADSIVWPYWWHFVYFMSYPR